MKQNSPLRKICFAGISCIAGLFIIFIIIETFFRAAIFLNISPFRSPETYAHYFSDDLYWILYSEWLGQWNPTDDLIHPLLGWTQTGITEENPFGLRGSAFSRLKKDGRKKILFYGDSFVRGTAPIGFQIPALMEQKLQDYDVLDFGSGGYGIDQIFLLFRETYHKTENSYILFGILMDGLDRSILSFRTGRKPYFAINKKNQLVLRGVPISNNKISLIFARVFRSYFFHFIRSRIYDEGKTIYNETKILKKKKEINRRIIRMIHQFCLKRNIPLSFILFYGPGELEEDTWQEKLVKDTLQELGANYLDTKKILKKHAKERQAPIQSFYNLPPDGHHNQFGNEVIANEIVKMLKKELQETNLKN